MCIEGGSGEVGLSMLREITKSATSQRQRTQILGVSNICV